MNAIRTRTFTLDRAAGKDHLFPAVAATETPVDRGDYWEVLDMRRADLSRAPLPFIESHDTGRVNIGIAENMRTEGDKLPCDVRLGTSQRGTELAQDIRGGIVTGLSIGYLATDPIEDGEINGKPVFRFAFCPHELSAVSVPADTAAGFFRSGKMSMKTERTTANHNGEDKDRVECITQMAEAQNLQSLGMTALREGWSTQQFYDRALVEVGERNGQSRLEPSEPSAAERMQTPNHYLGSGQPCDNLRYGRVMQDYSLTRLLRGMADPKELQSAGLELEISQDMQQMLGRRSKGILVPFEALQMRAVTAGGSGGNLVATDHLAGSFIDVLRNRSVVMNLNPTILRGLVGDVAIPKKTASATPYWIAGDNADSVTESDITLGQVTLSPNTVGGAVTFSHKMIVQSSPDIEHIVRQDLADLIASQIDLKSITGDGTGNTPTGILSTNGIGSTTYSNGGDPAYADIVGLETTIATANADQGSLAYLTTPAICGTMKTTDVGTDTGQFVWSGGMMNDLPAYKTGNMSAGYVLCGDWSQLLVGFWGGIEIDADPYGSNFLKGSVTVRVLADVDFGVRHAGAFAEIHEAAE